MFKGSTENNPHTIKTIATVLTTLFSPTTASVIGMYGIYDAFIRETSDNAHLWLTIVFIYILLSLVTLIVLLRLKLVSTIDISTREERPRVLALLILYSGLLLLATHMLGVSFAIPPLMLFICSLIVASFITLFWKISFHTFSVTLCILFLAHTYNNPTLIVLMIIPIIVAWTRVTLRKHTCAQTLGGIALGIAAIVVWSLC